jgi:RNA-binding protein NOB1
MRNLAVDDEQVAESVDAGEAPADEAENSTETPIPSTDDATLPTPPLSPAEAEAEPLYDDPSDEDDGEGEWITPSNVALHKSRALDLLPAASNAKKSGPAKQMVAACMTADFAMQNVLLHLGLNLVGVEGKRIHAVKTWVLRCHACFK